MEKYDTINFMQTIKILWSEDKGFNEEELDRAASIIREGGLVAFPTETVYGLGGNGLLADASKKIYEAKGRPSDNPLILHISDMAMLSSIVTDIPESAKVLADNFWPGPLTMVFSKKDIVPGTTTGGLDTVAVRMPVHKGALEFIARAGVPIAAPSANTSGRPSPTRAEHVAEDLDGKIDMIIDGGYVGIGYESTIVDVTGNVPTILRTGYITKAMLEKVVGSVAIDPGISGGSVRPKAPGMKYKHYAPKADMIVYRGEISNVVRAINRDVEKMATTKNPDLIGILATEETRGMYPVGHVLSVGSRSEGTAGRDLYDVLRRFDEIGVKIIYSENFDEMEKSEAIMNRLLKAAGQRWIDV